MVTSNLGIRQGILPAEVRGPVLIGFIGAYSTFSTYEWETLSTLRAKRELPMNASDITSARAPKGILM